MREWQSSVAFSDQRIRLRSFQISELVVHMPIEAVAFSLLSTVVSLIGKLFSLVSGVRNCRTGLSVGVCSRHIRLGCICSGRQ